MADEMPVPKSVMRRVVCRRCGHIANYDLMRGRLEHITVGVKCVWCGRWIHNRIPSEIDELFTEEGE